MLFFLVECINKTKKDSERQRLQKAIFDVNCLVFILGSIPNRNIGTSRQEIYFNAKLSKHTTVTDGHTVIFDMVSTAFEVPHLFNC